MRAYFFVNRMLNGIDKGIQAGHCAVEIGIKYEPIADDDGVINIYPNTSIDDPYHRWARDHKTFIVLNGGGHNDLEEIEKMLDVEDNKFMWASFKEDESLNFAMTAVGIILPERIYEAVAHLREYPNGFEEAPPTSDHHGKIRIPLGSFTGDDDHFFTPWEFELIKFIGSCPLAR